MRARSICRVCHRVRPVNGSRTCATCEHGLRAGERRRPPPGTPVAAPELENEAAQSALLEPRHQVVNVDGLGHEHDDVEEDREHPLAG